MFISNFFSKFYTYSIMITIYTFDSTNAKRVPINLTNIHDILWKAYPSINKKVLHAA